MPFDAYLTFPYNPYVTNYTPWVEVYLQSYTLYFADRTRAGKGATYPQGSGWVAEGRILSVSPVKIAVAEDYSGQVKQTEIEIVIANTPDGRTGYRVDYYLPGGAAAQIWPGAQVRIRMVSDYRTEHVQDTGYLVFDGFILLQGGIDWNDREIKIRCVGSLRHEERFLCDTTYSETESPKADPSIWDKPKPTIFGDWTDGYFIPCQMTQYDYPLGLSAAGHDIILAETGGPIKIKRGEVEILANPLTSLFSGGVTVDGSFAVDSNHLVGFRRWKPVGAIRIPIPAALTKDGKSTSIMVPLMKEADQSLLQSDQFLIKCQGWPYVYDNTRAAKTPGEIIVTLMDHLGLDPLAFASASAFDDALEMEMECRRYITDKISIAQVIEELLAEILAVGALQCSYRGPDHFVMDPQIFNMGPSGVFTFDDRSILEQQITSWQSFNGHVNRLICNFNYSPVQGKYLNTRKIEDTTDQASFGVREMTRDFKWLRWPSDVEAVSRRLAWMRFQKLRSIVMKAWYALKKSVGGFDVVNYQDISNKTVQWFAITRDPFNCEVELEGVIQPTAKTVGYWKDATVTSGEWAPSSTVLNGWYMGDPIIRSTIFPNNKIQFNEGAGTLTATIASGTYATEAAYAAAVKSALEDAGALTYTVARSGGVWTITATGAWNLLGATATDLAALVWLGQTGFSPLVDRASAAGVIQAYNGTGYQEWGDSPVTELY